MIVLKTDTPFDQLPVTDAGDPPAAVSSGADKVDETDNVGETGDPNLQPGETRTFTIKDMAAGKYVLVCNIAESLRDGHASPVHGRMTADRAIRTGPSRHRDQLGAAPSHRD